MSGFEILLEDKDFDHSVVVYESFVAPDFLVTYWPFLTLEVILFAILLELFRKFEVLISSTLVL